MLPSFRRPLTKALLSAAAIALTGATAQAAAINWTVGTIAADSDVASVGSTVTALNFTGANSTVNGVTFTGITSVTGAGSISLTGINTNNTNAFGALSTLSAGYQATIRGGNYANGATAVTVGLNNLTTGHVYLNQIWVNDSRANFNTRTETVSSGGNTVTLTYSNNAAANGSGQFATGIFKADSTSQAVNLLGNASTQVNAVQLRDVTNIGFWTGTGGATWDAATTANFATNAFNAALTTAVFDTAKTPLNSVRFADTYWNAGTQVGVTQNTINLTGGVTTGTVYFDSNTVNYTLNAAGPGLSGATALVKSGTSTLTLNGTNSHTGGTALYGGTLVLGSTTALGNNVLNVAAGTLLNNAGAITLSGASVLAGDFTVDGTANTTLSGAFSGTGTIYKTGSGTLTMTGNMNQFVTVNQGTLTVSGGTFGGNKMAGAGVVTVNSGATFIISGAHGFGGSDTGMTESVVLNGGTMTLLNEQYFNGITFTNATVNGAGQFRASNATNFRVTGGTSTVSNSFSLVGSANFNSDAGATLLLTGVVSSGGAFNTTGAGNIVMSGNNTYTGATRLSGGTLTLDYATNNTSKLAAAGVLNFAGGTLNLSGGSFAQTVGSTVLVEGTASAITRTSGTATIALGALTLGSGATLNLTGAGIATTTNSLVNGALVGVTFNGGLASKDGSNFITAYSGAYVDVARLAPTAQIISNDATANVRIVEGSGAVATLSTAAGTVNINSLTNTATGGPVSIAIGGTLRIGTGMVLSAAGASPLSFTGGNLTAGAANNVAGGLSINEDSGTATISAAIVNNGTGVVSLSKGGAGTLILSGANTYTGSTSVSGGVLQVGTGGTTGNIGAGAITINNGTLVFNRSDSLTVASVISGTGSLVKNGTGTVMLSAFNTYLGGTTVNTGALLLGAGGPTGTLRGVVTVNAGARIIGLVSDSLGYNADGTQVTTLNLVGGTFDNATNANQGYTTNVVMTGGTISSTGGGAFNFNTGYGLTTLASSNLSLVSSPILMRGTSVVVTTAAGTVPGGVDLEISGGISGTGTFTKAGAGTLAITGAGTYTGATIVNAGTLLIGRGGLNGSLAGPITNNAAVIFNRSGLLTSAGAISGSGTVALQGPGTVTLSASNNYTGATTVSAGRLNLAAANTSAITVASGAIFGGGGSTTGLLTLGGGSSIAIAGGGTTDGFTSNGVSFAGAAANSVNVIFDSALTNGTTYTILNYGSGPAPSIAALNGAAYRGGFSTATAGKITLTANVTTDTWFGGNGTWDAGVTTGMWTNGSDNKFYNGDTVVFNNPTAAATVTLAGSLAPASVTVNNAANAYTFIGSGGIASGSLTKSGDGALTLANTGANTYTGATTINAGTLTINAGTTVNGTSGVTTSGGTAALVVNGTLTTTGLLNIGANSVTTAPAALTIGAGGTVNAGSVSHGWNAAYVLNGTLNVAGDWRVATNAAVGITGTGTANVGSFSVANNSTITTTANLNVAGQFYLGDGSGQNGVYTQTGGTTTLNTTVAGSIRIGHWDASANTSAVNVQGGTFNALGTPVYVGWDGNGAFTLAAGATANVRGFLLGRNASKTSTLTVSGGTLNLGSGGIASAGTGVKVVTLGTATLAAISGSNGWTNALATTINGNTTVDTTNGNITFAAAVSGAGSLTKAGGGNLTLSVTNAYTGATTINAGTVTMGANNAIGSGALTLAAGTTLQAANFGFSAGALSGAGAITLGSGTASINQGNNTVFSGTFTSTGALVKSGAGTLTLTGANAFGATTVNAGTLQVGAGGTTGNIGTGTVTVASNATLNFQRSDAVSIIAPITGGGILTQSGTGTLTVSGANALASANATAGTLVLAGGTYSGASTLTGVNTVLTLDYTNGTQRFGAASTLLVGAAGTGNSNTLNIQGGAVNDSLLGTTLNGNINFNRVSGTSVLNIGAISGGGVIVASGNGFLKTTSANNSGGFIDSGVLLRVGGTTTFAANDGAGNLVQYAGTVGIQRGGAVLTGTDSLSVISVNNGAGNGSGLITLGSSGVTDVNVILVATDTAAGGGATVFELGGNTLRMGATGGITQMDTVAGALTIQNGTLTAGGSANAAGALSLSNLSTTQGFNVASVISNNGTGAVSLTKNGAGIVTLTGANTYTGLTTVTGGTLFIGTGGSLGANGAGGVNLTTSASSLVFATGGATSVTGVISGAGSLSVNNGTLVLGSNNTYTGTTTVLAGATLQVGSGGATGTIGGGTLTNNGTLIFNRTGSLDTAAINGTGSVVKNGAGIVRYVANNAYAGTTTINAGVLQVGIGGTAGTLGGGAVSVASGASLVFNRSDAQTVANVISGAGFVVASGAGDLTLTGANSGFGGTLVINQGARVNATVAALGTATIQANSSYGVAYASGGRPFLQVTDAGNATMNNNIVVASPSSVAYYALQKAGGGTLTLNGTLSGGSAASVLQFDSPTGGDAATTFVLNGNNTIAGEIRLNRGVLVLGSDTAAGTASLNIQTNTNANGNLVLAGNRNIANNVLFGTAGNTVAVNGTDVATLTGRISGSVAISKVGTGALRLTNANNTYSGVWSLNAGALRMTTVSAISASGGLVVGAGTTLGYDGIRSETLSGVPITATAGAWTVDVSAATASLAINPVTTSSVTQTLTKTGAGTLIFRQVISGAAGVNANAGTLVLSGANTYTGVSAVLGGATLQLGEGTDLGALGTGNLNIAANGTFIYNKSNNAVFGNNITGAGQFIKDGAGTLTLTPVTGNTLTGLTTVRTGVLRLGNANAFGGQSALTVLTGARFEANNFDFTTSALSGSGIVALGNATGTANQAVDTEFSGEITGSATSTFAKAGTGTLTISGTNSTLGRVRVDGGTLSIGNGGASGSFDQASRATVAAGATLLFNRSGSLNFGLDIDGAGNVVQNGPAGSVVTLTGTNTYTGLTSVLQGTLRLGSAAAFPGGDIFIGAQGTFDVGSNALVINLSTTSLTGSGKLNINGGGDLTVNATADSQFDGVITGSGDFIKSGAGEFTLTGQNAFTGTLSILDGRLVFGGVDGTATASGTVSVVNPGSLVFDHTAATTFASNIQGDAGASFVSEGAGATTVTGRVYGGIDVVTLANSTLTLSNTQNVLGDVTNAGTTKVAGVIGGDTTVTAGVLTVGVGIADNVTRIDSASVTVAAGATLVLGSGSSYTISTLGGDGVIEQAGAVASVVTIAGDNSATLTSAAKLRFSTGSVAITAAQNVGDATLEFNSGTLIVGTVGAPGTITLNNAIVTALTPAGDATLSYLTGNQDLELNGPITGTGFIRYRGPGALSGASIPSPRIITDANPVIDLNGANLSTSNYNDNLTITNTGTNANLIINQYEDGVSSGVFTGNLNLVKNGDAKLTLAVDNSYTGTTVVNAGTLEVGNGGTTGTIGTGAVVLNGGLLSYNRSDAQAITTDFIGAGAVGNSGSGPLTLSGELNVGGLVSSGAGIVLTHATVLTDSVVGAPNQTPSPSLLTAFATRLEGASQLTLQTGVVFGVGSGDYSGVLSGSGRLVKSTAGTLVISADGAIAADTNIQEGVLQLGAGGTTGSIGSSVYNVAATGTLAFNRSDTVVFGARILGAGQLRTSGTGTLVLAADNGYTGKTTIDAGATLRVGNGGTTGKIGGGLVQNDGTLEFNRADANFTFANTIVGNGGVHQLSSTTLTLSGNNTYRGLTQVSNGGTIVLNTASLPSGAYRVDANSTLNFTGSGAGTLRGALSGDATGTVTFTGTGNQVTLEDAAAYAGRMTVGNGATLRLGTDDTHPATIGANSLTVLLGGRLTGSATIAGNLVNQGVIAPGFSPGYIKVGGDFNTTGTLNMEIAGPGAAGTVNGHDQIDFGGVATLAGVLNVNFTNGFNPTAGFGAVLMQDTAPVAGQNSFGGDFVTVNVNGASGRLLRSSNALVYFVGSSIAQVPGLSLAPGVTSFANALSPNATTIHPEFANFYTLYASGGPAALATALQNASPVGLAALTALPTNEINKQADELRRRAELQTMTAATPFGDDAAWLAYAGGTGALLDADKGTDSPTFDSRIFGGYGALERRIGDGGAAIGVRVSYDNGNATLHNGGGKIEQNRGSAAVYALAQIGEHGYVVGTLGMGYSSYDTKRNTIAGTQSASPTGWDISGSIDGGYIFRLNREWSLTPHAGLTIVSANVGGFTERGSDLALAVDGYSQTSLTSRIGTGLYREWVSPNFRRDSIRVGLDLAYEHALFGDTADIPASFANFPQSGSFTSESQSLIKDSVTVGPQVQWIIDNSRTISLGYRFQYGFDGSTGHRGDISFEQRF